MPTVSLIIALALTWVHLMLWWWLRRQHGRDKEAWIAALAFQGLASLATVAISVPFTVYAVFVAPPTQVILLMIGAKVAAQLSDDAAEDHAISQDTRASTSQLVMTAASVVVIAIGSVWAALPRPIPDGLEQRLEAGDWPRPRDSNQRLPVETVETSPPSGPRSRLTGRGSTPTLSSSTTLDRDRASPKKLERNRIHNACSWR